MQARTHFLQAFKQHIRRVSNKWLLEVRDFRLLWGGEACSLIGTQVHFAALSWLTLQLTRSGEALGTVVLMASVARVVFMLLGGALADRLTPRFMMLLANLVQMLLSALLALLVAFDTVHIWHLYGIAFLVGLMDAFFRPAYMAILPRLIPANRLGAGVALLDGTTQLSRFVGPVMGGMMIRWGGAVAAFGFDAFSFLVAAVTLVLMRAGGQILMTGQGILGVPEAINARTLVVGIGDGLRYVWRDRVMRPLLMATAMVNFLLTGPLVVGLPVLARVRFGTGPVAFGAMLSAFGGGALLGALIAGSIRQPRRRGIVLSVVLGTTGVVLATLSVAPTVLLASAATALVGLGSGFAAVIFNTWLQQRADVVILGRVFGLVLFAAVILEPISYALAGQLADRQLSLLFLLAGSMLCVTMLIVITDRDVRALD